MSGQQWRHSSASAERRQPPEPWHVTTEGQDRVFIPRLGRKPRPPMVCVKRPQSVLVVFHFL